MLGQDDFQNNINKNTKYNWQNSQWMKYNPGNNKGTKLKSNIVTDFHDYKKDPNECKCTIFNVDKIVWIFLPWNKVKSHDCHTKPRYQMKLEGIVVEKVKNCDETGNSKYEVKKVEDKAEKLRTFPKQWLWNIMANWGWPISTVR